MGATDPSSTRDRALAIATELFAERGFHGVSLAHVAEALGFSKQAVLHHFSSKEKLYGEVLSGIASEFEAVIEDARRQESAPDAQLKTVFATLQHPGEASCIRTKLLVRELMDIDERKDHARTWHLRRFLDELTTLGRSLEAWSNKSDEAVFAAIYQLIGAVSYFAISEATLTGMYGRRRTSAIKRAFAREMQTLVSLSTGADTTG